MVLVTLFYYTPPSLRVTVAGPGQKSFLLDPRRIVEPFLNRRRICIYINSTRCFRVVITTVLASITIIHGIIRLRFSVHCDPSFRL